VSHARASAPIGLAIRTARQAGLALVTLDRDNRPVVYSDGDVWTTAESENLGRYSGG
jgi:formate dehydrogenase assembly factor FdhD